jgi:hypothetical protein
MTVHQRPNREWIKMKNPNAPAVKREAEEYWDSLSQGGPFPPHLTRLRRASLFHFQNALKEWRRRGSPAPPAIARA